MSAMGMDTWSPEKKAKMKNNMFGAYFGQFVASFVTFSFLAWLIGALSMTTAMGGLTVGLGVWIGFSVPSAFGKEIWGGKMSLFWMGIGAELITLLVVGAILGAWR